MKEDMIVMKWHDKKDISLTCHDVSSQKITPARLGPKKMKPTILFQIIIKQWKELIDQIKECPVILSCASSRKNIIKKYSGIFWINAYSTLMSIQKNRLCLYKKNKNKNGEHVAFLILIILQIMKIHVPKMTYFRIIG